ncbi:TetR/AcrR family transcriptional regulator [Jatrophihabitans sp.]|uniref:TetR/AcrR family transcriptional regulator n=1 Tax=Jatrophihabitans sp. TaxID=1932789 RepID=UPI002CAE8221|nr:TetR/AcrR family transcriptional regulator [Jatrophihabitans sp.]
MTSAATSAPDSSVEEPGRQRKRGAELERAIKDATIAELADGGYGSVTIESVAARAQTGKASIYRRWPTKQELVLDALGDLLAGPLLGAVEMQLDDKISTRDALLTLVRRITRLMTGMGGDAMRSIMGESLRDATFCGTFECDFFDPRKQVLLGLLERGVRRGEVRPEAVSVLVPEMLAGTLIHRVVVRRRPISDAELVELVDEFVMPAISPR